MNEQLPGDMESKLSERERKEWEQIKAAAKRRAGEVLEGVLLRFPHTTLLECPIAVDNRVEVRVSHWPTSVNEFDVLVRALSALRSAFLASRRPRKR